MFEILCNLEKESKSGETIQEGDDQSEGEISIEQQQEQPAVSKVDPPQTRAALVKEKLKSVLILFLFYGKWVLDKLIGFLNGISKDYRAVARQLKKARREKRRRDSIRDYRLRDMMSSESMEEDSVDAKVGWWGIGSFYPVTLREGGEVLDRLAEC